MTLGERSRVALSWRWALALFLFPLLLAQGWYVRRTALRLPEGQPPVEGTAGQGKTGISIIGLGDSVIAGVGVGKLNQSLTACVADRLAEWQGAAVAWRVRGRNGDRLADLLQNLRSEPIQKADIYLISIGVNDVSGLTGLFRWQLQVVELFRLLPNGSHIMLLGLPPMERFTALPQPLAWAMGVRAALLDKTLRQISEVLTHVACVDAGRKFDPAHLAEDGYHPNAVACVEISREIVDAWAALREVQESNDG